MLRGKLEGEMALLYEGSSIKESPEDKQASAPCAKGSAKISWWVTLALYTGYCCSCFVAVCINILPEEHSQTQYLLIKYVLRYK